MSDNSYYVAKNPENAREELAQMADLISCPEETILDCYDNILKELPRSEAYKACVILLEGWQKHYIPLMDKLRRIGSLKKVGYEDL